MLHNICLQWVMFYNIYIQHVMLYNIYAATPLCLCVGLGMSLANSTIPLSLSLSVLLCILSKTMDLKAGKTRDNAKTLRPVFHK